MEETGGLRKDREVINQSSGYFAAFKRSKGQMLGEPVSKWQQRNNPNVEAYEGTLTQEGNNFVAYAHIYKTDGVYFVEVSCYDNKDDFSKLSKAICIIFDVPFVALWQATNYANETMLHMVTSENFRNAIKE